MISLKVPDMTCQQYDAKDHDQIEDCSKPDLGVCRDCTWPPPPPVIYMIFLFGLNELNSQKYFSLPFRVKWANAGPAKILRVISLTNMGLFRGLTI